VERDCDRLARVLAPCDDNDAASVAYANAQDPWFDVEMTHTVVIEPEMVTGMRLTAAT
jgi:hypothetical protein